MKFSLASLAVVALATQTVVGDGWFGSAGRTAYNKWHETELERWLSDHDIPYPKAADRKDLQDLVQKNWDDTIVKPYNKWDTNQLSSYLGSKGQEVKKGSEKNKNSLLKQVEGLWSDTVDSTNEAWTKVEGWVFDTWTDSQLKSFLDYHDIPNPSPRTRDSLLHTARANYQKAATKAGQTSAYPGNWLWESWSDSDLKAWLDERGIPAPQPGNRDKLIATIRRNSKVAADRARSEYATASSSAASAQSSLSDQLIDAWSDSQLKEWFDKAGIKVPQGSKRNELVALARKHSNRFSNSASSASGSAASAFGAATTNAGNNYAQATDDAYAGAREWYDWVLNNVGMASANAQSSISSASSRASVEASKSSNTASSSASKASKSASKSGQGAYDAVTEAYQKATDRVKEEL